MAITVKGVVVVLWIVLHINYMMECPIVIQEREHMWDLLHDRLPVQVCAQLLNGHEETIYCNLFSADLVANEQYDEHIVDNFLITVAQGLMKIFKKVAETSGLKNNADVY